MTTTPCQNATRAPDGSLRLPRVSFAAHFDSLMRGRRGAVRPRSEAELNGGGLALDSARPGWLGRHIAAGLLSATGGDRQLRRADVEALALAIYHWRHHLYDVDATSRLSSRQTGQESLCSTSMNRTARGA